MLDAFQFMDINNHNQPQPSQEKPACSQQNRMLKFCVGMRGLCRDILLLRPMETEYTERSIWKRFSVYWKKTSKTKVQINNNDFRKVITCKSMLDALYNLHSSNYERPPIDFTVLVFENRQNEIKFARAKILRFLRALKHLMETRLISERTSAVIIFPAGNVNCQPQLPSWFWYNSSKHIWLWIAVDRVWMGK